MFATVTAQPLRQDRSSEKEKTQLANDTRDAVNMTSKVRVQVTTKATGVFTPAWISDDVPEGAAWSVQIWALGRAAGDRGLFGGTALYYREPAGATVLQGAFGTPSLSSNGGFAATFIQIGNAVSAQVKDDGVKTVDWEVIVEVFEAR